MSHIFNDNELDKLDSDQRRKLIPPALVLDEIPFKPGDCLVEVGAGTGYFTFPALARVGESGKARAVDISDKMIQAMREKRKKGENIEISKGQTYATGLADGIADIVLLAFVLHEVEDKSRYARELIRLLKDKGKIVVVEWDVVESPMGPPLEERITHAQVKKILEKEKKTGLLKHKKINLWHYLDIYDRRDFAAEK